MIPYWLVALIWMIPIRLLIEYPGYEGQSFLYILWKNIFLGYDNGQLLVSSYTVLLFLDCVVY